MSFLTESNNGRTKTTSAGYCKTVAENAGREFPRPPREKSRWYPQIHLHTTTNEKNEGNRTMVELILIALLGHPNYNVREQAHEHLAKMDYQGYLLAARFTKHPDREISRRCLEITSIYLSLPICNDDPLKGDFVRFHGRASYVNIKQGKWGDFLSRRQNYYWGQKGYDYSDGNQAANEDLFRELLKCGAVKEDIIKIITK